jgi:uncharacterized protein YndB with AHSA1/START domain
MTKQIEVSRIFDAPVEIVWKLWTESELIKRWWGPKQFTSPVAIVNFAVGQKSIVSMLAPKEMGGQEYYSVWKYTDIVHLQKIEFIQSLSDKHGNKVDPTTVGMPSDFPIDLQTIVTFKKLAGNKTEMTVTENGEFGSISNFARLGLEQSMDKMLAII